MINPLRKLLGRPPRVTVKLPGLRPFPIETHGRSDIYISRVIEDWGYWEPSNTAIMRQLCAGAVDFIDIGANIGWYTLVAAHALAGRGQVHSFEPDPAHVATLRGNVALNRLDNVTVNSWALSDHTAVANLYLNEANRGSNSLFAAENRARSIPVELRRLDDYSGIAPDRPLVMKIDVEGAEIDVLGGAERLLRTHPHEIVVMCEMSPRNLAAAGRTTAELAAALDRLGFAAALIDRNYPRVVPMSWERLADFRVVEDQHGGGAEADFLAFRRIDGLMAPMFRHGEARGP
jgi:FkbM family methyltransferase